MSRIVWQRQAKLGDGLYEICETIPKAAGLEAATHRRLSITSDVMEHYVSEGESVSADHGL